MTLIILTRTDNFSIIISDTRETTGSEYTDGFSKLRYIPSTGFITGSGWADFLEEVKKRVVKMRGFKNPGEVIEVFKKTADEGKGDIPDELIDNSFIIFSWVEEIARKLEYNVGLLSESYYEKNGSNSMMLEKGDMRVIYPVDILDKEVFKELLEKAQGKKTNNMSINQALFESLRLFVSISDNSDLVSSDCQIGIQYYSALTKDIHHETIEGNASKLTNLAQKNKILNKFGPAKVKNM